MSLVSLGQPSTTSEQKAAVMMHHTRMMKSAWQVKAVELPAYGVIAGLAWEGFFEAISSRLASSSLSCGESCSHAAKSRFFFVAHLVMAVVVTLAALLVALAARRCGGIREENEETGTEGATLVQLLQMCGHNYIGHNYIGHNYIGHNYIGTGECAESEVMSSSRALSKVRWATL